MKADDIKTVLILGAGTMGQQTAILSALHGMDVVIYDISQEILEAGQQRIKSNANTMTGLYPRSQEELAETLNQIKTTTDPAKAARDADIIIESVPEDPELKGHIFGEFNQLCRADTIFASNTSSLIPSMFAQASGRPDRLCALHFHDVTLSKIVDVMPHPETSPETLAAVEGFARRMGQIPIVLKKEHHGYVFNNMLMALLDSALTLAQKKVTSIENIDRSWMGVLHTMVGPFGLIDSIGLDTTYKITDYWAQKTDNPQAKANASFLKEMLDQGYLGIKSKQGFYTYPNPDFMKPDFLTRDTPAVTQQ